MMKVGLFLSRGAFPGFRQASRSKTTLGGVRPVIFYSEGRYFWLKRDEKLKVRETKSYITVCSQKRSALVRSSKIIEGLKPGAASRTTPDDRLTSDLWRIGVE